MTKDEAFAIRLPKGMKDAAQEVVDALKILGQEDKDTIKSTSINKLFVMCINNTLTDLLFDFESDLEAIEHEELRGASEINNYFLSNPDCKACSISDFDEETQPWYYLTNLKDGDSDNPNVTRAQAARLYADELEKCETLGNAIKALREYLPGEFIDAYHAKQRGKPQSARIEGECPFD